MFTRICVWVVVDDCRHDSSNCYNIQWKPIKFSIWRLLIFCMDSHVNAELDTLIEQFGVFFHRRSGKCFFIGALLLECSAWKCQLNLRQSNGVWSNFPISNSCLHRYIRYSYRFRFLLFVRAIFSGDFVCYVSKWCILCYVHVVLFFNLPQIFNVYLEYFIGKYIRTSKGSIENVIRFRVLDTFDARITLTSSLETFQTFQYTPRKR